MRPTQTMYDAGQFRPESRYDETQEITLADLLSTEEQDAHESAQLAALRAWLREES